MSGYCATGSAKMDATPMTRMTMEMTHDRMGRSMKNAANTGSSSQRGLTTESQGTQSKHRDKNRVQKGNALLYSSLCLSSSLCCLCVLCDSVVNHFLSFVG